MFTLPLALATIAALGSADAICVDARALASSSSDVQTAAALTRLGAVAGWSPDDPCTREAADAVRATTVRLHRAVMKQRGSPLLLDVAYDVLLRMPLDDTERARLSSFHGDVLYDLGRFKDAIARFRTTIALDPDPQAVRSKRDVVLFAWRKHLGDVISLPDSGRINFGAGRRSDARAVFCCTRQDAPLTDDERAWLADLDAFVADYAAEPRDDDIARYATTSALLHVAHGGPDAADRLRAVRARFPARAAELSLDVPLLHLLWVRGDPSLHDEVRRLASSPQAGDHAARIALADVAALLSRAPLDAPGGSGRAARLLRLLEQRRDIRLDEEMDRIAKDPSLARDPLVAAVISDLRHVLIERGEQR